MKTKLLVVFLCVLYVAGVWAQPQAPFFNTGFNPNNGGLIPVFSGPGSTPDYSWRVSNNGISGSYGPAYRVPAITCCWCQEPPSYPAAWISYTYNCVANDPANHVCLQPPQHQQQQDLFYRIDFTLPANPLLLLNWDICADDKIAEIFVNNTGTAVWTGSSSNNYSSSLSFKWCSGWVQGNNFIIIHVISGIVHPAPSSDWTGLMVVSWPTTLSSIVGPTVVCPNSTNHYSISPVSGNNYNWLFPSNWTGTYGTNQTNVTVPATPGNNVIYSYVFSGTACVSTGSLAVTVTTSPVVHATANPSLVCPGAHTILKASGATTYTWSAPVPTGSTQTNPVTVYPLVPTTYSVTGTSVNGCTAMATVSVDILPTPVISINASTTSICPGFVVQLQASGANTYSWTAPVYLGNIAANPVIDDPSIQTTYQVTGTALNTCTSTANITINMLPLPNITINATPSLACAGVSNTLTASGASSYTWQPFPPGPTGSTLLITSGSGSYPVMATGPNGCTNTAVFNLNQGQLIPLSTQDATVCSDLNPCTTITVSTPVTPVSFTWQPTGSGNQSVTSVCPAVRTTTVYTVSASSPAGCANSTTLAVTAIMCCPTTGSVSFYIPPVANNCQPILLGLDKYLVPSTAGVFSGVGVTLNNGVYNFNSSGTLLPGNYTIAFTYTEAPYGCPYTLYQTVTIDPPPPLITSSEDRCGYWSVGAALGATLSGLTAHSYSWAPANVLAQNISVTPTVTTVYTVTALYGSCTSTALVTVNVNYTCCPQSSVVPVLDPTAWAFGSPTTLYAGLPNSVLTGPIIIDHNLVITANGGSGDFEFQTGDFIIGSGITITLEQGVNLKLTDAHLYGCAQIWKGIVVMDGANVTSAPGPLGLSSMIEDAATAIDIDGITANHATPLLNLDGVIFNKNWIGINVHNSQVPDIQMLVKSCVFTTRNIPTGTLSWPSTSNGPGGLRYDNGNAATSLDPPFMTNPNYPYTGIPYDYNSNIDAIGINIETIGDTAGGTASPGIDLTSWYAPKDFEFNLFDHMHIAIYVNDASLTTINNTFQYSGVTAIWHGTSGTKNVRLSLTPQSWANPNTGNRFWLNEWGEGTYWIPAGQGGWFPNGIIATNVLEFDIEKAIFRGNPGSYNATAIDLGSNRFSYRIRHNSFNNLSTAIYMSFDQGAYYLPAYGYNGWLDTGVNADSLVISENFFGPETNTSIHISNEVMNVPIYISGANNLSNNLFWRLLSPQNYIQSNTIDRAQSGIAIMETANYPLEISNNNINVINTTQSYAGGLPIGIWMEKTQGGKSVKDNFISSTLEGMRFVDNTTPEITCNVVTGAKVGFSFYGDNTGIWEGNVMKGNTVGLYLDNGGIIGQQGNMYAVSGNQWIGNTYDTDLDPAASAYNSILVVTPGTPYEPMNNIGGSPPYDINLGTIAAIQGVSYQCIQNTYPPQPRSRSMATSISENKAEVYQGISFYPNPTSGNVTITSENEGELLRVKVIDLTGKLVFSKTISNKDNTIDISSLKASMYFIEIEGSDNKSLRKKLIKTSN